MSTPRYIFPSNTQSNPATHSLFSRSFTMPTLDQHQSNDLTKMIVLGDPGSGKTGG